MVLEEKIFSVCEPGNFNSEPSEYLFFTPNEIKMVRFWEGTQLPEKMRVGRRSTADSVTILRFQK